MERKLSQRDLRNNYKCYATGYCSIWNLTRGRDRNGWNSGVYGWNFDAYISGNVCITTGYRPIGKWIDTDYVSEFENRAKALWDECTWVSDYSETKQKVDDLFAEFIKGLEA